MSKPEISVHVNGVKDEKETKAKKFDKYEIRNAAHTIMEAHQHMNDKEMMKEVNALFGSVKKRVRSTDDLRAAQQRVAAEENEYPDMDDNDTPDDKASKESKSKRVKNSSSPTVVGKVMK